MSTKANVRVASAARNCYNDALQIGFNGGYFAGIINVSLGLLGISFLFIILLIFFSFGSMSMEESVCKIPLLLVGYGFGGSFVAMLS